MDCKVNGLARPRWSRCEEYPWCGNRESHGRRPPLGLLLAVWFCFLAFTSPSAESAELVMFEAPLCEWCEAWDDEVGVVYHKTSEGRRAPLRRVALHGPRPADLSLIMGMRYSPTFVLVNEGREVGRIVGYPGEDHFWGLLQVLLDDMPGPLSPDPMGEM